MRHYLFLLFFILAANLCFGKTKSNVKPKAILQTDTSAVTVRYFDADSLKAYSSQPEFQYNEDKVDMPAWTRFWRWFWQWIGHLFESPGSKGQINPFWGYAVKYLFIALGLGALIFLILKLIGIDLLSLFSRRSKKIALPYSEFLEDINQIDFDTEIENAVAKHNYRFAVRLLYLKCLKQLSDAELIKWQIDKTNSTYINEIANNEQRIAFNLLTRQFEYVWYGEFLIDGNIYKDINACFQHFNKSIA